MGTSSAVEPQAFLSNGFETEFVVTTHDNLYLRQYQKDKVLLAIALGPATKDRIDEIISNLNRLKSICN